MRDLGISIPGKPQLPALLTHNLAFFNRSHTKHTASRHPRSSSKPRRLASDDITKLNMSFSPAQGIQDLRNHKWRPSDLQYAVLAFLTLFSLYITPSAPILKALALCASAVILLIPATRQFALPSSPIWVWLLYFFSSRFIDNQYRPHIWVRVLPALENVLYGANLSNILSAHQHAVLDILAWLPYGIMHFAAPAVCSAILFLYCAPGTVPVFARTFGWMCILGVTIQLIFPCTPPWYENERGLVPAAYGMSGSPAGLARIDKIFGVDLYTTNFSTAPVPFGAFPSLHSGNAVLEALFMSHAFPKLRTAFIVYAAWVWWATMYLSHHYAIDLVGGGLIAASFFYTARARWLPRRQEGRANRWAYDYVEIGERNTLSDEEYGQYVGLSMMEHRRDSSDAWTLGGASSSGGSSNSSVSGSLSPTVTDVTIPGSSESEMEGRKFWDGPSSPRRAEIQ